MFEKASRLKLRFSTTKGYVMVEDLWDLSLTQLNKVAVALSKELKESDEVDFLQTASSEDVITKLQFDIVLHILKTKLAEKKAREEAGEKKAKKEKLLNLLARKEDEALLDLTPEEIKKQLEDL